MGKPLKKRDPRTEVVSSLRVGDVLCGSRVKYIKDQRKGGKPGVRITLEDRRSTWSVKAATRTSLNFNS
jgi:hypothetical protein